MRPRLVDHLIHEVSGAGRTVGIDASERYIAEARHRHTGLDFMVADVSRSLPIDGADSIVARFLLTHLAHPAEVLAAWAATAAPGARLALHETEVLTCEHPALTRYYEALSLRSRPTTARRSAWARSTTARSPRPRGA